MVSTKQENKGGEKMGKGSEVSSRRYESSGFHRRLQGLLKKCFSEYPLIWFKA